MDLRHVASTALPRELARAHHRTTVGEKAHFHFPAALDLQQRLDLLEGAGFEPRGPTGEQVETERVRSLADTVGPDLTLLICGLNPSPASADDGVGFARPGNRFWPAALAAGLVSVDRDAQHALEHHHLGMTDLVKRTTRRADELTRAEYIHGLGRLERLAGWLEPSAICFVGLAGWRAAADRKAGAGWQDQTLGGRPVYLMPSTSGLNAHSRLDDLTAHLEAAARRI